MQDAIQLPLRFDPGRMQHDLQIAADIGWTDHFVTRNYEGSWSVIALRAPAGVTHPVQMIYADPACNEFVDTPILQQCLYFREVLEKFPSPLHAVRLMRLAAGSHIKEHTDVGLDCDLGHVRLHVPVVTNPGVEFYLNRRRVIMNEGECWYLRLSDPHSVQNKGTADRVHLVIDAVADENMMRLLQERDAWQEFREMVLQDEPMQRALQACEEREAFIAMVISLGAERGFVFTRNDVRDRLHAAQQLPSEHRLRI